MSFDRTKAENRRLRVALGRQHQRRPNLKPSRLRTPPKNWKTGTLEQRGIGARLAAAPRLAMLSCRGGK